MRTAMVVGGVVVTLHVVVAVAVLSSPGCQTRKAPEDGERRIAVMPEPVVVTPVPERRDPRPVVQPPVAPPRVDTARPVVDIDYKEYEVKSGDVLSRIANRAGVSVAEIVTLNNLDDANRIVVGQTLLLPPHARVDALPTERSTPPVVRSVPEDAVTYEVRSGDALSMIAQRFNTTVKAIMDANDLRDPNLIRAGQKLVIPGGARAPAPSDAGRETAPRTVPETRSTIRTVREMQPEPRATQPRVDPGPPPMDPDMEALFDTSGDVVHVVGQGETLDSIAAMYGKRADDIQRYNALGSRHVTTGQTLKIPRD